MTSNLRRFGLPWAFCLASSACGGGAEHPPPIGQGGTGHGPPIIVEVGGRTMGGSGGETGQSGSFTAGGATSGGADGGGDSSLGADTSGGTSPGGGPGAGSGGTLRSEDG